MSGYVVLPWGAQWICGRAEIDGDDIVLASETLERIDLYERERQALEGGRQELALQLAAVETPFDACAVARTYGLLLRGPDAQVFREPFSLWETVSSQARLVLQLAVHLEQENVTRLDELVSDWRHRLPPDSQQDTLAQASLLVEGLLNDGLQGVREAVVSAVRVTQDQWRGPSGRLFLAPQFDNLIGYAFHRLVQTISYRCPDLFECVACGRVEARTHGNQTMYCRGRGCAERKRRQRARAQAKT